MRSGKVVLITGGSSGIGFEVSRLLARDNFRILWAALEEEELAASKKTLQSEFPSLEIDYLAIDLSQEGAAQVLYQWANQQVEPVDILINNAGFATFGYLLDISESQELAMLHLNVRALYQLTRLFLGDMQKRAQGQILNISSSTSLQPVPKMSAYAATKAFVKHFSLSLAEELKMQNSPVFIGVICPAGTKNTNFQKTAGMQGVRTFNSVLTTTPQEVAQDAYRALQKRRVLTLSGARLRNSYWLQKITPSFILNRILKRELETE